MVSFGGRHDPSGGAVYGRGHDPTRTCASARCSSANPFSVGCVLVHDQVAATWSLRDGRVVTAVRELTPSARDPVEAERAALEAFHR